MRNLIFFSFILLLSVSVFTEKISAASPINQVHHSKLEKNIILKGKISLSVHNPIKNIFLFQGDDYLRVTLNGFYKELIVEIEDDNHNLYFEGAINKMETEWWFNTSLLPENKRYTIKLKMYNGGFLIGHFDL